MAADKNAADFIEESHTATERKISVTSRVDASVIKHGDRALALIGDERVSLTEEENKHIRRSTDKVILVILVWVYFLQIIDKTVLGYGATFGLKDDTGLVGNQYSLVGSIAAMAQLGWQPFSSFLIVKVPHRILMPCLVLGWGIAQTCMAACHNYGGLLAARFFLGLFEAGCLPLFSIITSQWYRRAEQPMRVAAWYSMNGIANLSASLLSYGFGHVQSPLIKSWQLIFMFVGLLTIISAPFVYWKLDNDIPSARFLTEEEKPKAIERLRANQTGTGSREFKMKHVWEMLLEPKTYLWIAMSLLLNSGASVTTIFGPLIISGLGFDKYRTALLNIPFAAMQFLVIVFASWAAQKFKNKSLILLCLTLPVVAGLAMLYSISHTDAHQGALLAGYYLLAFLFGGNPLIVSWIVGNTAGTTKKSVLMSVYNAASAAGNIIGPLLFRLEDSPEYRPGLKAVLGLFVALAASIIFQVGNLMFLNKLQGRKRVRNGKPQRLLDRSMQNEYHNADDQLDAEATDGQVRIGDHAFEDLTDRENDEFIYLL